MSTYFFLAGAFMLGLGVGLISNWHFDRGLRNELRDLLEGEDEEESQ